MRNMRLNEKKCKDMVINFLKYQPTVITPIQLNGIVIDRVSTVSDKNSRDTLTKRCFFPPRAPLVTLKVVYRCSVTKSCTPTLRGQADPAKCPSHFD